MNSLFDKTWVPAWYEIGVRDAGTLLLHAHRKTLAAAEALPWATAPGPAHMAKTWGLEPFTPPREGNCGFGETLVLAASDRPEWVTWEVPLPKIRASLGEFEEWPKSRILSLRATLDFIFRNVFFCVHYDGLNTNWPEGQLLVVEGVCLPDPGPDSLGGASSGSLSASITPDVCRWLAAQPHDEHCQPIVDAMRAADGFMWEGRDSGYRFGAWCRQPKWLNLSVPGNACGLDPDGYNQANDDSGYELVPHNVDSTLQQLTLLVGLAKLHDLVRADHRASRAP